MTLTIFYSWRSPRSMILSSISKRSSHSSDVFLLSLSECQPNLNLLFSFVYFVKFSIIFSYHLANSVHLVSVSTNISEIKCQVSRVTNNHQLQCTLKVCTKFIFTCFCSIYFIIDGCLCCVNSITKKNVLLCVE